MAAAKPAKERLDKLLVERGLCETRSQAQSLILAGSVMLGTQVIDKPGTLCVVDADIRLKERPRFVSRGGLKLEKALQEFGIDVKDRVCMDVGASTGGFTDCLLQYGAAFVHAIDVGYGQLDWRLRQDARVSVREKTHIVDVAPESLTPPPSLAVVDVSFISLKKVLPRVTPCLTASTDGFLPEIVALVKPQFEYRDYCALKGFNGVVTDPRDHALILKQLAADLSTALPGWLLIHLGESPLKGPKGNREFLFHLQLRQDTLSSEIPAETWLENEITRRVFNKT